MVIDYLDQAQRKTFFHITVTDSCQEMGVLLKGLVFNLGIAKGKTT